MITVGSNAIRNELSSTESLFTALLQLFFITVGKTNNINYCKQRSAVAEDKKYEIEKNS